MRKEKHPMDPILRQKAHYAAVGFLLDFFNLLMIALVCLNPFFGITNPILCACLMVGYGAINVFLGEMCVLFPNRHILKECINKFLNFCVDLAYGL